jgi:hypothetical protein
VSQARERGTESAGDEGVEGAKAGGQLGRVQAALAVEPTEKVRSGATPFERIALDTARNEVAVGIILELDARDDMVEAAHGRRKAAPAIETTAAFASMDDVAQSSVLEEVQLLKVGGPSGAKRASGNSIDAESGNLRRQAHLDSVAGFAALHKTQGTAGDEAAHSPAHGVVRETSTTSEPRNGEPNLKFSLEAAVAEEMGIGKILHSDKHFLTPFLSIDYKPHWAGKSALRSDDKTAFGVRRCCKVAQSVQSRPLSFLSRRLPQTGEVSE